MCYINASLIIKKESTSLIFLISNRYITKDILLRCQIQTAQYREIKYNLVSIQKTSSQVSKWFSNLEGVQGKLFIEAREWVSCNMDYMTFCIMFSFMFYEQSFSRGLAFDI